MTNVEKTISLFREEIKKFEVGEDYELSLDDEREKETYSIRSLELKKSLRKIAFGTSSSQNNQNEKDSSVSYKAKECDAKGNCFSYKGKKTEDSEVSDELIVEKKLTLSPEEIERRRKEVEQKRKEIEELKKKGKPAGDYTSRTIRIRDRSGGESRERTISKDDSQQTQQCQQACPPEGK